MKAFGDAYRGRRVLLTGHTGFKGSWLALWLDELGAEVTGMAQPPIARPNHWELLQLDIANHYLDLRDTRATAQLVARLRPEVVFHLAAQSLVRRSYRDPLETWSTNVMGTANLLDACLHTPGVRAIVVVTTDKCYENRDLEWSYRETDRLGGHDPYSASKAAAEMVAASFRKSYFTAAGVPLLATARAGNVIGGGDWSEDRLIPDLVRAVDAGSTLEIRAPAATRPWQHVLESLAGYLLLGAKLLEGDPESADAWNFGPASADNRTVSAVLTRMTEFWPKLAWEVSKRPQPHEAHLLHLDSTKARTRLGWVPVWHLDQALEATASWYRSYLESGVVDSRSQLTRYVADARASGAPWCAA